MNRGKKQEGVTPEETQAWLVDALVHLTRAAREKNVGLAIQPMNRYETDLVNQVADLLTLIEAVGADNLGILFDTFHAEHLKRRTSKRACVPAASGSSTSTSPTPIAGRPARATPISRCDRRSARNELRPLGER